MDITGQTFTRLTALSTIPKSGGKWLFRCSCGTEKAIQKRPVVQGIVRSCGCLHRERARSGLNQTRHGDAKVGKVTRLHNIWRGMLKRCSPNFPDPEQKYRARGITVCEEWQTYETFKAWALANGYADHLTIEREDNDGNYCPSNCRWVTQKEQARNRRTSRRLTIDGREQTLAEWSEETGVGQSLISHRLRVGWPVKQAVMQPPNPKMTGRPRLK